jgi:hypothetical protein
LQEGYLKERESARDAIDELFTHIRLRLVKLRQSDAATTDELKNLLTQLEDWIEKLIMDSLKLEDMQKKRKNPPGQAS